MIDEKDKVILYVWEYIETKENHYKVLSNEWLTKLARKYNINLKNTRKQLKGSIKEAFRSFLKNDAGYMVTLQRLYDYLQ
jgi:hypothetical protein